MVDPEIPVPVVTVMNCHRLATKADCTIPSMEMVGEVNPVAESVPPEAEMYALPLRERRLAVVERGYTQKETVFTPAMVSETDTKSSVPSKLRDTPTFPGLPLIHDSSEVVWVPDAPMVRVPVWAFPEVSERVVDWFSSNDQCPMGAVQEIGRASCRER